MYNWGFTCINCLVIIGFFVISVGGRRRSITEYRKHIIQANSEEEVSNVLVL